MDFLFSVLYWYLGERITLLLIILVVVAGIIEIAVSVALILKEYIIIGISTMAIGAFVVYLGMGVGINGTSYMRVEAHLSQEYDLKAVHNTPSQQETTSTSAGLLVYASTTTIDSQDVIRYIRSESDDKGLFYTIETQEESKIKIYEKNDQTPKEKVYNYQTILTNPMTGDTKVLKDEGFSHVELIIPEGSVVSNYDISLK